MHFIESFENKIKKTIKDYKLLSKNDKIVVAASGGKDSTTILYLLNNWGYNVEALFLKLFNNKQWNSNYDNIAGICAENRIKLRVYDLKKEMNNYLAEMHKKVSRKSDISICALCGVLKRNLLNSEARRLGADKLVTGHNLDDEAETILLNIFGGHKDIILRLCPDSGLIKDSKFVPRVKPLYFCTNNETKKYAERTGLRVNYEKCPESITSFRKKIRQMISELEKNNPKMKTNLVNNFIELLPKLRKNYQYDEKINYCTECGEPGRNELCKKCELLKKK